MALFAKVSNCSFAADAPADTAPAAKHVIIDNKTREQAVPVSQIGQTWHYKFYVIHQPYSNPPVASNLATVEASIVTDGAAGWEVAAVSPIATNNSILIDTLVVLKQAY
jgi:hypothetical protein